jgi:hypothetical protein
MFIPGVGKLPFMLSWFYIDSWLIRDDGISSNHLQVQTGTNFESRIWRAQGLVSLARVKGFNFQPHPSEDRSTLHPDRMMDDDSPVLSEPVPLIDLLELQQDAPRNCGDERDHLFSLLSMSREKAEASLQPDYKKTTPFATIILRYANLFVQQGYYFRLLHRACVVPLSDKQSSWVPDWTSAFLDPFAQRSFVRETNLGDFQFIPLWDSHWVQRATVYGPNIFLAKKYFHDRRKEMEERIGKYIAESSSSVPSLDVTEEEIDSAFKQVCGQNMAIADIELLLDMAKANPGTSDTLRLQAMLVDKISTVVSSKKWDDFRRAYVSPSRTFSSDAVTETLFIHLRVIRVIVIVMCSILLYATDKSFTKMRKLWILLGAWCIAELVVIIVGIIILYVGGKQDITKKMHGLSWDLDRYIFDSLHPWSANRSETRERCYHGVLSWCLRFMQTGLLCSYTALTAAFVGTLPVQIHLAAILKEYPHEAPQLWRFWHRYIFDPRDPMTKEFSDLPALGNSFTFAIRCLWNIRLGVLMKSAEPCFIFSDYVVLGDEVWRIRGSNIPFVLRPSAKREGYYRLVGECYTAAFLGNPKRRGSETSGNTVEIRIH